MSDYVVSARKYRPQSFDEVVGQAHVARTLSNALESNQLAQAFLFCGPRGVGKTTCARILARVLNCDKKVNSFTACSPGDDQCDSCKQDSSFNIFELDAASNNSVDHIRNLIDQVRFRPQAGDYKIFIIDEVHMLSTAAFNAFLKTLEEPPSYAIFILATTEKHKIIPTILSRCQIFNFKRIPVPEIVSRLKNIADQEKLSFEEEGLQVIAQKADGALRDALSIFDKVVSSSGQSATYKDVIDNLNILDDEYYFKITDACIREDATQVVQIFNEILKNGFEPEIFIQGLSQHFRNIRLASHPATQALLETSEKQLARYVAQSELATTSYILNALNILNQCDLSLPRSNQKSLHVELALTKIMFQESFKNGVTEEKKKTKLKPLSFSPNKSENLGQKPISKVELPEVQEKKEVIDLTENKVEAPVKKKALITPSFSSNLDTLLSEVKSEKLKESVAQLDLSTENIKTIWDDYLKDVESMGVRSALTHIDLEIQGNTIVVYVPNSVSKDYILQEKQLIQDIREKTKRRDLGLNIVTEASRFPDFKTVAPKKMLSVQEKQILMIDKNPKIQELIEKFALKPEK